MFGSHNFASLRLSFAYVSVTVIAQLLGILPSTMLAAATWHHTSSVQAIMMLQKQQRPPITMVLLRDGEQNL